MRSELEQNKIGLKLSKEAKIKRAEDVFDKVKLDEPLSDIENFFVDDSDISSSDEISEADRQFVMELINRTTFIDDAKKFMMIRRQQVWRFLINLPNKKSKRRTK